MFFDCVVQENESNATTSNPCRLGQVFWKSLECWNLMLLMTCSKCRMSQLVICHFHWNGAGSTARRTAPADHAFHKRLCGNPIVSHEWISRWKCFSLTWECCVIEFWWVRHCLIHLTWCWVKSANSRDSAKTNVQRKQESTMMEFESTIFLIATHLQSQGKLCSTLQQERMNSLLWPTDLTSWCATIVADQWHLQCCTRVMEECHHHITQSQPMWNPLLKMTMQCRHPTEEVGVGQK